MLSVIVGNNGVGKTLLMKRLKEMIQSPSFLISVFPNNLPAPENEIKEKNAFENLDLPETIIKEKKVYFDLFLQNDNINRYEESIKRKLNIVSYDEKPPSDSDLNVYDNEKNEFDKKGFTNSFNSNDFFKDENKLSTFKDGNSEHLLKHDLHPKELKALVKKYQRIISNTENNPDLNLFIQKQIIKKLIFTNLFLLLKQECFYNCELDSLNSFLNEKQFPYVIEVKTKPNNIIDENTIYLIHRKKGFYKTLSEINNSEKIMLHFHLIVRDRDLIKIHDRIDLNQIVLFDQIDEKLDFNHSNELIEMIKFNFVKYLNIQCIMTTNNHSVIDKSNDDCLFRMIFNENKKEIVLENFKNDCKEMVLSNKTRMKIPFVDKALDFHIEKKSRNELSMELILARREIEMLNESLRKSQIDEKIAHQIMVQYLEENKKIKEELRTLKENNLQIQNSNLKENSKDQTTFKEEIILENNKNIENILEKSLDQINDKESKYFIEYLSRQVDSFEGRSKDMIKKMIDLLGPNLYTSELSFLNEIVQNFDDAEYLDLKSNACLKVVLNEKFILFSSNQSALKPKEVKGICSIGESTKMKGILFFYNYLK